MRRIFKPRPRRHRAGECKQGQPQRTGMTGIAHGFGWVGSTRVQAGTNLVVRNAHLMSIRDLSALLRKADTAMCTVTLVAPAMDVQLLDISCASRQTACEVVHYGLTPLHLMAAYSFSQLGNTYAACWLDLLCSSQLLTHHVVTLKQDGTQSKRFAVRRARVRFRGGLSRDTPPVW